MAKYQDKDKGRLEQERLQHFLTQLLKDEDNRYCADCDAKGPRWASWNLGVFLCIRCAGIHRNLGVHISKVKSVNLDSWTPEQVQSMRVLGNSVGRAVYEANLPDNFRRPQSDQAMEAFIRAKYEQKRYLMKDWVPQRINAADLPLSELSVNDKPKKKTTAETSSGIVAGDVASLSLPKPAGASVSKKCSPKISRRSQNIHAHTATTVNEPSLETKQSSAYDLVDLSVGMQQPTQAAFVTATTNTASSLLLGVGHHHGSTSVGSASSPNILDDFGAFASAEDVIAPLGAATRPVSMSNSDLMGGLQFSANPAAAVPHSASVAPVVEVSTALNGCENGSASANIGEINLFGANASASDKKTKDDILKLYGSNSSLSTPISSPVLQPGISGLPNSAVGGGGMSGVLNSGVSKMSGPYPSSVVGVGPPTTLPTSGSQQSWMFGATSPAGMGVNGNPFGYAAPPPSAQFSSVNSQNHLQQVQNQLANLKVQKEANALPSVPSNAPSNNDFTGLW